MNNKLTQEQVSILLEQIRELKKAFSAFSSLIGEQIHGIVNQKYDIVAQKIEQQVQNNDHLNRLEKGFQNLVIQFSKQVGLPSDKASLQNLAKTLENPLELLEPRAELLEHITMAQNAQMQLLYLIQFGQSHINDTLQAINNFGSFHDLRYGNDGKRVPTKLGGMLNRQV